MFLLCVLKRFFCGNSCHPLVLLENLTWGKICVV